MKRIIVPTDFSECAMSALKIAAKVADKIDAVITLVHAYELPVYGFTGGKVMYDGKQIGKIKEEIHHELGRIAKMDFIKKYKVETHLLPDFKIEDIVTHKTLKTADLVVMGTNGASGIRELIGSNAERIIRKSISPVLVVREGNEKKFNPKNIVFASSFYGEVYERFPKVKSFAEMYGAKIHLLNINTPKDFMTTEYSENLMISFKEKFKLKDVSMNVYNDESVEDGVINFCKRIKADMLVLETHGRTGLNHILNGSIAEDVVNHISIPLLTFKIKESPKPRGVIFPESR